MAGMQIGKLGRSLNTARMPVIPAGPPYPATLLTIARSGDHIEALRSWGYRIGLAARDALTAADAIESGVGERASHVEAISNHFGLTGEHHSLHVEPLGWLRVGETQAMKGLKHFLARDDARIRLFLRSLVPAIPWPSDLAAISVEAETRSGRGRIDLLIYGESQGRVWGAVVEAKFEHGLKGNPLGQYARHGSKLKMALTPDAEGRTGALVVLGKTLSRPSRKKMSRHPHWRFVHWREVLRRFDAGLTEATVDEDFRRFRRTLWERSGSAR
jgi:hypothetical protein